MKKRKRKRKSKKLLPKRIKKNPKLLRAWAKTRAGQRWAGFSV